MASIKSLGEQALRRINSGDRSIGAKVHPLEVQAALQQALNMRLAPQYFDTLNAGEGSVVEGSVLATYSVPVTTYGSVSKATLPAIPVKLPGNRGVWRVGPIADPFCQYIPIPMGQTSHLLAQRLLSDLVGTSGQIGYELRGKEILFTKDLPAQSVTSVEMELVVADFSNYTEYELLPIDANLEAQIVDEVVKMFSVEPSTPQIIDSTPDK